jgi:glyoxylase-like metal-dependent hydrolase (beta-lactamase superfamily II)
MTGNIPSPIEITPNFYQLGTPPFPAYLSIGEDVMIIEGGTGPTTEIIIKQIETLGINPDRIKYMALTHTHADHIGAVPRIKLLWPHVKIISSAQGARILGNKNMLQEFLWVDNNIAQLMKSKGEINEPPAPLEEYDFNVDLVVEEGDRIELGAGIVWTVYSTPGHSPCHIALYEEKERSLAIGDTTGFYVPKEDIFWPNYFDSLEAYTNSIRKLSTLPAKRGVLSHNCVITGSLNEYFSKAINATEAYHNELIERINKGEDAENIAREKAEWVNSLTDIQPFKVMLNLSRLLLRLSQKEAKKEGLFGGI